MISAQTSMTVEKYPTVIFVYMRFLYTKLALRRNAL